MQAVAGVTEGGETRRRALTGVPVGPWVSGEAFRNCLVNSLSMSWLPGKASSLVEALMRGEGGGGPSAVGNNGGGAA